MKSEEWWTLGLTMIETWPTLRQLRGYSHEAQTVAVPTPVFAESSTSESLFGQKEHNPPNVATTATVVTAPHADARTAAKQQKMAQPSSQHSLTPVPPLSETDRRYKTALVGFETAMKEDPTSHATDVALQSVVDLLHGAEVLGDASLGLGSDNDSSAPDNSEEAAKKRAAELRREEVVKAMAQLCREQDEFNQEHGSSILRWKVCYGAKPTKDEPEAAPEAAPKEEAKQQAEPSEA